MRKRSLLRRLKHDAAVVVVVLAGRLRKRSVLGERLRGEFPGWLLASRAGLASLPRNKALRRRNNKLTTGRNLAGWSLPGRYSW